MSTLFSIVIIYLISVYTYMFFQIRSLGETYITMPAQRLHLYSFISVWMLKWFIRLLYGFYPELTIIWFLRLLFSIKYSSLSEFIWFISSVNHHMNLRLIFSVQDFTLAAFIWFIYSLNTYMVFEIVTILVIFVILAALIWFFTCVSHMG